MEKMTAEEFDEKFDACLNAPPYPVEDVIGLIAQASDTKRLALVLRALDAFAAAQDFPAAFRFVTAMRVELEQRKVSKIVVRDALRKATKDRLQLAFINSVGFDLEAVPLKESLGRLTCLLGFHPGAKVLSPAWGLGEIKRLDYFYRRITVDFRNRRGHQMTFDAACETLRMAPEGHILVKAAANPDEVARMIKEQPGEFVKAMLSSFGDMPITRLEELTAQHGFVKEANWKKFWEAARTALHADKCVDIPTRRAEPLHLKASAEGYDEVWFQAFTQMKDAKCILASVRELEGSERFKKLDDAARAKLADRLAFALKWSRGDDDALYARVAFCLDGLKLDPEAVRKARAYLWAEKRYLAAAERLPARETETLVSFLTAEDRETTKRDLFAVLPEMCFALLSATLTFFKTDADLGDACAALLRQPNAPATLVTYLLARYADFKHWTNLPSLVQMLMHAIVLGEGKQSGEILRMQNVIRRLFADEEWLKGILAQLSPADQACFFERFQASIAWDPSTHHRIVMNMTKEYPDLKALVVKKVEVAAPERITSMRSYAERKAAYQKLINVDMPANTKRIEFAKSFGDLSENAEYAYAKDEQRALMQKQAVMQAELNEVKAVDFANVLADVVRPGTTVVIRTAAGEERTYTVLGEWDNDLERNIISNKAKLAENLLGKKAGDVVEITDAEGNVSTANIVDVRELSVEMREWVKVPAGFSI